MASFFFIRIHETLRITPAMAAGVTDHLHDFDWLLDKVEAVQPKPKRPKTYKKRAALWIRSGNPARSNP